MAGKKQIINKYGLSGIIYDKVVSYTHKTKKRSSYVKLAAGGGVSSFYDPLDVTDTMRYSNTTLE